MIFWTGYGSLAVLFYVLTPLVLKFSPWTFSPFQNAVAVILVTLLCGVILNRNQTQTYELHAFGKKIRDSKAKHTFCFLPLEFAGFLFLLVDFLFVSV